MMGWASGPMVALDFETTGRDPHTARIVTAAVLDIRPGCAVESETWLADPGVEIDPESTEVHGITTERARAEGRPAAEVVAEVAGALAVVWSPTTPLVVYNAPYDLTLLRAELHRHHLGEFELAGPVIDPLVIDRTVDRYRKGSRKLADVCRHYGISLDDAHEAGADALAAARLAWLLARRFPGIGGMSLADLHDAQPVWHAESCRSLAEYLRGTVAGNILARAARAAGAERAGHLDDLARLLDKADQVEAEAGGWPLRHQLAAA